VTLVVDGVSKRYAGTGGPVEALRDVSLRVEPGEMVSVVGPNGAGKTTLLQIVAGVVTPSSGRVVRPRSTSSLLEVGSAFDPDLTGSENLQLGLAISGVRPGDRAAAIRRITEFAGLEDSVDLPVKHYSDGMIARLSAAQAVDQDAELLVMDEAMSVGDASFERRLMRRIDAMRERGSVVLVATHSLGLARSADRTLWLRDGEEVRSGPAAAVLRDYELSAGVGRPVATESSVRFRSVSASPTVVAPGHPLQISVDLEVLHRCSGIALRVEVRPVVGEEPWMRPSDPAAAPADVLVAVTACAPLGQLAPGLVRAVGTIPALRITSTVLEVSVVAVDPGSRIHDEISCTVQVEGRAGRPAYFLRAEIDQRDRPTPGP
jgi:ABC-type polysaccharide/polyol phosphate transport system ATPase subunit